MSKHWLADTATMNINEILLQKNINSTLTVSERNSLINAIVD